MNLDDMILDRADTIRSVEGKAQEHYVSRMRQEIRELKYVTQGLLDSARATNHNSITTQRTVEELKEYVETHLHAIVELLNTRQKVYEKVDNKPNNTHPKVSVREYPSKVPSDKLESGLLEYLEGKASTVDLSITWNVGRAYVSQLLLQEATRAGMVEEYRQAARSKMRYPGNTKKDSINV